MNYPATSDKKAQDRKLVVCIFLAAAVILAALIGISLATATTTTGSHTAPAAAPTSGCLSQQEAQIASVAVGQGILSILHYQIDGAYGAHVPGGVVVYADLNTGPNQWHESVWFVPSGYGTAHPADEWTNIVSGVQEFHNLTVAEQDALNRCAS